MKVRLASRPGAAHRPVGNGDRRDRRAELPGMTIREVVKKSKEKGIEVRVIGSGWAIAQQPAAGMPAPEDRLCTVTFGMGS